MDKLKYVRFEESQGVYGENVPIAVDARNVDLKSGYTLEQILGQYNYANGDIQTRLRALEQAIEQIINNN